MRRPRRIRPLQGIRSGSMLGIVAAVVVATAAMLGCESEEPIVTYTVPTNMPTELEIGDQQIIGAIVPQPQEVWFFKIRGPEDAVSAVENRFRDFVRQIDFQEGTPQLDELPEDWRRGGEKPMRYATIHIPTPDKQLELSVSKLARQDDWDQQVTRNVNRWRRQVGLPPSAEKWAEAEALEVPAADGQSMWVNVVGQPDTAAAQSGRPPMAAARGGPTGGSFTPAAGSSSPSSAATSQRSSPAKSPSQESKLSYDRPEGWRDGRMSSMRMAAFNVGPQEAPAEVTVIAAGGDTRGNVARWLGQLRETGRPSEDVVDQALADAQSLQVNNRDAQRFVLKGKDPDRGNAIDATIVPLEDGFSLFVKMTGPVETVTEQSDEMASFLTSLKL